MTMRMLFAQTLLLATALLSVCANDDIEEDGDTVTWAKCKQERDWRGRILVSLPDHNATDLDIMDCRITNIKIGDFDDLPNLVVIFLNNNQLEHLDVAVFDPCRKLEGLRLDSNKLREVPAFGEYSSFPNVTWIDLSRNLITKIDNPKIFSSKLQSIDLDYNPIEHLHPDIFKGLPDLNSIMLSSTKISSIPNTMFQIESLKRLFLRENLIEYVPSDAFLGTKLKVLSLEGNRISFLPVNFITDLKTSRLEIYFYSNPWNCACLLEILAEVKRIGVREYGAIDLPHSETRPECVFDGRRCRRISPPLASTAKSEEDRSNKSIKDS